MSSEVIYKVSSSLTFTWSIKVVHKYEMIITITELLNFFSNKINKNSFSILDATYGNNPNHVNILWKDALQSLTLKHTFTKPFFSFPNTDTVIWMLNC